MGGEVRTYIYLFFFTGGQKAPGTNVIQKYCNKNFFSKFQLLVRTQVFLFFFDCFRQLLFRCFSCVL